MGNLFESRIDDFLSHCFGSRQFMLVLARKVGEKILIGENISVTVVRIAHGVVRIGIEAPTELPVVREEILKKIEHADSPKEVSKM